MRASFYLTPDIKARLVDLAYRRGDTLEPWAGQTTKLIEQDPSKGDIHKHQIERLFIYANSNSGRSHGRGWIIRLC